MTEESGGRGINPERDGEAIPKIIFDAVMVRQAHHERLFSSFVILNS
jgi:hypothetical protein